MKTLALKSLIGLSGSFAGFYLFFLASVFYALYGPSARFCGTAQAWALEGAALIFAPVAVIAAVGLWVMARTNAPVGPAFGVISRGSRAVLSVCVLVNLLVFLPVL
jgi:hypothetical protein